MDRMKVLVLVHKDLIPPEKPKSKEEWETADWKTEFDVVSNLKKAGHIVECQGVESDLLVLKEKLDTFKPRIVFNLLEEFAGEAVFDQNVVSYLEMKGVRYTGASPRGLMLSRDKMLAKKLLHYHRIPTPRGVVFPRNRKFKSPKIDYPLFVKTLNEEASLGITQGSIVHDDQELKERVAYFHEKYSADALAEQYIEGRELYVGILGNHRVQILPTLELFFDKLSERAPKIATSKVKWDYKYRKKYGIKTGPAKDLSPELIKKIQSICKRAYRALELSGYARLDLRLKENGDIFLIEANPNPDVAFEEELADAALADGLKYPELLNKILRLGLAR